MAQIGIIAGKRIMAGHRDQSTASSARTELHRSASFANSSLRSPTITVNFARSFFMSWTPATSDAENASNPAPNSRYLSEAYPVVPGLPRNGQKRERFHSVRGISLADSRSRRRSQAEIPLVDLSEFGQPSLVPQVRAVAAGRRVCLLSRVLLRRQAQATHATQAGTPAGGEATDRYTPPR